MVMRFLNDVLKLEILFMKIFVVSCCLRSSEISLEECPRFEIKFIMDAVNCIFAFPYFSLPA